MKTSKSETINEIEKFKIINKLKSVYRMNSVDKRKESSAEHSWSCLILADYLINKYNIKANRLKIYELLMYHDLAEIYAGDSPLNPNSRNENKKEKELAAAEKLRKELPEKLADKYYSLFIEFEEEKTEEAKFAKLVDVFDAQIHEMDYKSDWKGWTKEFLLNNKRSKCFDNFPEIKKDFHSLLDYFEKEGYFNQ